MQTPKAVFILTWVNLPAQAKKQQQLWSTLELVCLIGLFVNPHLRSVVTESIPYYFLMYSFIDNKKHLMSFSLFLIVGIELRATHSGTELSYTLNPEGEKFQRI